MSPARPSPWSGRAVGGLATAAALVIAGCSAAPPNPVGAGASSSPSVSASASSSASAVSSSSRPVYPLTGLPAGSSADVRRPAVAVDVSGTSPSGLSLADVVFEEVTSPVRYIAVYQSHLSVTVGPVTSTQPTDRGTLAVLHPLIAYDGGAAAYYVPLLDKTKIIDVGYSRDPSLYTSGSTGLTTSPQSLAATDTSATAPPPLFTYRDAGQASTLASTGVSRPTGVSVTIPGLGTQAWSFDARTNRWTQTSGGPAFSAANLIIQDVPYTVNKINAHRGIYVTTATVTGSGKAEILSGASGGGHGGTAASGTWNKPHPTLVTNYLDASGNPMALQPGPTWVILAPPGTQVSTSGT